MSEQQAIIDHASREHDLAEYLAFVKQAAYLLAIRCPVPHQEGRSDCLLCVTPRKMAKELESYLAQKARLLKESV